MITHRVNNILYTNVRSFVEKTIISQLKGKHKLYIFI